MDWLQFSIFFIGNLVFTLTLWLWNRTESRNDIRAITALISVIQTEMKEFHGRLCEIEARNRK